MVEALCRVLFSAKTESKIVGIKSSMGHEVITNHQFVDDTILVAKANIKEAKYFMEILKTLKHHHIKESTSIRQVYSSSIHLRC